MKNKFNAGLFAALLTFIVSAASSNADKRVNLNLLHTVNSHKTSVSDTGNSVAAARPISEIKTNNIGKLSNPKEVDRGKDSHKVSKPTVSLPNGLSKNWWQDVQQGIAKAEYRPEKNKHGLQASNRAHNLRTYFEPTGIRLYDRTATGSPKLADLSLSRMGRGENLESVPAGSVNYSEVRVEIRRPGITEWYQNSAQGLEQGFTLPERTKGQGALVLELAVKYAHATLRGQSIELTTDAGRRLNYRKLIAQDAHGKLLPSHMEVPSPHHIRLVVEDIEAAYPLVIDPLLTGVADTLLESNDVWSGSFDSAMFGFSVSGAGDVNGDGFNDVVVGAYGWDTPGGLFDEGAAFVFLGGPNGIEGTDPTTANAMLLGDQAGTEFGNSISGAGDVNGDGFDDIIVGSHHYNSTIADGTLSVDGAAFVFLGGPNGIVGNGPSTAHASIFGNALDSRLGHVVSKAGDVNGDGFDDIIVGAPLEGVPFPPNIPPNQRSGNGGAALVFLGSAVGITGTGFDDADSLILPYPPGQPVASAEQLGADVSTGDVNGDGFDDVLVGAAGYVLVFHGSAAGIVGTDPGTANAKVISDASVNVGTLVSGAGDVNGDGFDDILLSDTGYPTGVTSGGHGAFMVFHGSALGITATSPADADTFIEGDLPIVVLGPVQNLGWRLSGAGDVDGDGFGDIIVGALEYPGSLDLEGTAYVFRGSATGLVGSSLSDAYVHLKTGQAGAAIRGNKQGFDVAGVGDVNGDGFPDLLMAAGLYDAGQTDEGAVFVYHGGSNGTPPPTINSFSAIPGATSSEFTLMWTTTSATSVSIDNGVGAVAVDGSVTVTPTLTTTYTVTATGAGGTTTSIVTITVDSSSPPQGAVTISGPTSIDRGDSVSFTVTLTNSGTTTLSSVQLTLAISPSRRIKDLSPANTQNVANVLPGGSVSLVWTGKADKEGIATITTEALSGGVIIDAATLSLTIIK